MMSSEKEIFLLAEQNNISAVENWLMNNKDKINDTPKEFEGWSKKLFVGVWAIVSAIVVFLVPPPARRVVAPGMLLLGSGVYVARETLEENTENWTLLHFAARGNALRVARFLIKNGADHEKKADGKTFLEIANRHRDTNFIDGCLEAIEESKKTVKNENDNTQTAEVINKLLEDTACDKKEISLLYDLTERLKNEFEHNLQNTVLAVPLAKAIVELLQQYATVNPRFTEAFTLARQLNERIEAAHTSDHDLERIYAALRMLDANDNEEVGDQSDSEVPLLPDANELPAIEGSAEGGEQPEKSVDPKDTDQEFRAKL